MKVELTYPKPKKQKLFRQGLIEILKWPFLFAAYICPVLNLTIGGRPWSVIVLWSLYFVWSTFVSPTLVEYNRISQLIKLIADTCVLLVLTDFFLAPGWAVTVVPIVCFSGLILAGVLFFTDFDRQTQNMRPMLLMIIVSIVFSVVGLFAWQTAIIWPLVVMGALALALLAACAAKLGQSLPREFKKWFYT